MRTGLIVVVALHATTALAQKGPVETVQEWIQNLQKPQPPPKPPEPPARNTVTMNPFALEHERLGVEYERALFSAMSFYVAPQGTYGSAGPNWTLAVGADAGLRFYVLGEAPNGLYIGPSVTGIYTRSVQAGVLRKGFGVGLGANAGLSVILLNRFALAVGFTAEYMSQPDLNDVTGQTLITKFTPLPKVAFGVAF